MAQEESTTSELTIDVTCTPRNRANLRRLKTTSIQSFQRWEKENELLYAMIEDESAWLSSLFPDAFITPELFFYALEDGTILCLLANFIQERAENFGSRTGKSVPGKTFAFNKSKKGSRQSKLFHSRENVDKFLTWCRWHGIPEAILFESNDAVLVDECRTGGREIVICLMEIARRSSQYEIEVPQMIKLEREIEAEELSDIRGCAEEQQGLPLETNTSNKETRGDRSPIDSDSGVESVFEEGDPASPRLSEFVADESKIIQKNKSVNKFEEGKPQRVAQKEELSHSLLEQPKTELDKKVCKIAQEYNIKVVHRLKEGKYIILGKTMFVRMLNDHLLVRIGGGWDTLDHYVMTHASKSTASEEITAAPPDSNQKSSGVWSKLLGKVKRRESQPNLTESPVVISKHQRPESTPSVYKLRDRVKKKLSVTEKDEKDISDAIRKIESSLTVKSSSSSFTSKTFFQLKNRFDKGRKGSQEYLFNKKEPTKMADQTIEAIGSEQETEAREERGTTMLLDLEASREDSTGSTTLTEFPANESSSQKQDSFPLTDDFGLFDQQARQSSEQNLPITDPDDLLSNDNPPLFSSETLQPEQARDENQIEIHKDEGELPSPPNKEAPEPATDFLEEIGQQLTKPTEISSSVIEEAPTPPSSAPDDNEPTPDIEKQLENVFQETPAGDQTDFGEIAGESDLIKVRESEQEVESAPGENDLPELYQGEQQQQVNDHLQISDEQTEAISDETKQEDVALPTELPNDSVTSLNVEVTIEKEEKKLEDVDQPPQVTFEGFQSSEMGVKGVEYVSPDTERGKEEDEAQVPQAAVSDMVEISKEEEPEVPGGHVLMPVHLDKDAVSKEQEEPEESKCPAQITDEISQDERFEQQNFPEIVSVVESEKTVTEHEQLENVDTLDEEAPKGESVVSLVGAESKAIPVAEEPKAEQDKIEQKEVPVILQDTYSAPVSHLKTTKKAPGTTKKENVKAGNSSTSKNLSARKKEEQRGERPKASATKPASTRTAKSTPTTTASTAPKTKTVPAVTGTRSASATKRPVSAQPKKTGIGASRPDATKTTPKTTPKPSEPRKPLGTTTTKSTADKDNYKKSTHVGGNQKSKSAESRPRSGISTKSTDKKDGKPEAPRPISAKTMPSSGTTKTTVKKTTTISKTSGPTPKSEAVKTTIMTSGGGTTSKTKTATKKVTETGGKTKAAIGTPHQTSSVRNTASGVREKPGSASMKSKPSSASAKGKSGSTMAKGKPTTERPKSPTKATGKKTTAKDKTTVSASPTTTEQPVATEGTPAAAEPAASAEPTTILSLHQEASDLATPAVTADSKEPVTSVIHQSEVIQDEEETVLENGERQTITKETLVEAESG